MSWLRHLPHQIPFRAASAVVERDGDTISGDFVCTADDEMPAAIMLVEAMAQFAGGLALENRGFLTGIDACEIDVPILPGDRVRVEVIMEASFGGTHRLRATAWRGGVEIGRGRFYLATGAEPPA